MEISYWQSRWEKGNTGWHMDEVYPHLTTYWPELELKSGDVVLVPLCGKTLDMLWLNKQGFNVIGVDVSEKAARLFFDDHGISYQNEAHPRFSIYTSEGIQIWVGDFLKLQSDDLPEIDAIYDKAALIALPASKRKGYAETIIRLCQARTQLLVNAFEYEQQEMNGPPFSVKEEELQKLFGRRFTIRQLHEDSIFEDLPKFQTRGLRSYLTEKLYHLDPD